MSTQTVNQSQILNNNRNKENFEVIGRILFSVNDADRCTTKSKMTSSNNDITVLSISRAQCL